MIVTTPSNGSVIIQTEICHTCNDIIVCNEIDGGDNNIELCTDWLHNSVCTILILYTQMAFEAAVCQEPVLLCLCYVVGINNLLCVCAGSSVISLDLKLHILVVLYIVF